MKEGFRFIWVDDSPARKKDADNLQDELGVKVDFVDVNKKGVDSILVDLVNNHEPDLVIMDHRLDFSESETYKTGSTAATFLHESWPNCPIISVTAVEIGEVDIRHRSAYEAMIQHNHISENYQTIMSIAQGFSILKSKTISNVETLLSLFEVNKNTGRRLAKIFPKELKENFEDTSLHLEIYRWCVSVLFSRPGFLYDELWTATFLGLTIDGFKKIKNQFEKAKYKGLFADSSKERWWKDALLETLTELTGEVGIPWRIGHKLVNDESRFFARCHASDEYYPETVAAEDVTLNANWYPMRLKNTESHPHFEDMLFFEELRIMKPAE